MAITIKHAKTDTIADWTQTDLDAQIALGNFPAGTTLADIVLPSDWNNDHTLSGTVPIANGGTGQTTANAALNALLPSQSSNTGKVLSTDGTNTSWIAAGGTGTVTSVSGVAPVTVATGTTTPVISMAAANASTNGYLTSTDWTTFNSKAPATSGTSILYGNGSGGFSNVTVGTGLSFTAGTLSSTSAGGDVVGPSSATDNAIARYDTTTGKLIQNSVVTISDTGDIAGATTITDINYIDFNTGYTTTLTAGQLGWDGNNTLGLGMSGGNVVQEIGLQLYIYGKASSAVTKGQLIKKSGVNGTSGVITFAPTTANMTNSDEIIGIAAESISLNGFGYVISTGNIRGFNTTGSSSGETWVDGDALYYNPSGSGLMTNVKPSAPNLKVQVGIVTNASSGGSGSMVVEINHGSTLGGTDSNVQINGTPSNGQILTYDTSNSYWKNTSLTAGTGISVSAATGGALTVTNSAPDQVVSLTGAGTTTVTGTYPNFTITSSDTYSGTVTSVSVVSANGLAGTVANATTTPAITLSTTVTGLLKGNGTAISAATSGTDYAPATSGSSILYGNGSGGFSNVTVGTGLSFSAGTLSATATGGVTSFQTSLSGLTPSTASTGVVTLAGTLGIGSGGTGQTTANAAFNALAPSQTSNTGKYLKTDGTDTSWATISTYFPIYTHAGTNSNIPIANGYFTIVNHAGSTINIPVY